MFFPFRRQAQASSSANTPKLTALDESLYPLQWGDKVAESAEQLLQQYLREQPLQDKSFADIEQSNTINQKQFSHLLLEHPIYQDWVNFTVFGRYVQRSFSAFYRQSEDVFNSDMPEILRYELMRHTQVLPTGQVLLFGGNMSHKVRQDKLLMTTLNPFTALDDAIKRATLKQTKTQAKEVAFEGVQPIINVVTVGSERVKAFAVKHNKRTRDSLRNEVMILDFAHLVLIKEESKNSNAQPELSYLIRHYTIN